MGNRFVGSVSWLIGRADSNWFSARRRKRGMENNVKKMKCRVIKRNPYQKQKKETDTWCSRFIRLRDSIAFYKGRGRTTMPGEWVECYTCGRLIETKHSQAGHWKSRGIGGQSGIYFDIRAIRTQCPQCNAFKQGSPKEYTERMVEDWGQKVLDELEIKHKVGSYSLMELVGLEMYFKTEVEEMLEEYHIQKWWK